MSLDYFSPDGSIVCRNNTVTPVSDRHPDDCTSVTLASLRAGAPFSAVTGWRGMKSDMEEYDGAFLCHSYDDGSPDWLPATLPVWEHVWGGWPAANAKEHDSALHV